MKVEVYEARPEGFEARVEVAACYLEIDGRMLLLQNALSKSEPGKWGVPAGKRELQETPVRAAQRELYEETGIAVESCDIQARGCLYIRNPSFAYIYYLFHPVLRVKPEVRMSKEHMNFLWADPKEIAELPLMGGALEGLQKYRFGLIYPNNQLGKP